MTCQEFVDFLHDYLAAELPEAQRDEFERHLDNCPCCVTYLKSYEETIKLGKSACKHPDDPVPEDVPEDLLKAILAARGKSR